MDSLGNPRAPVSADMISIPVNAFALRRRTPVHACALALALTALCVLPALAAAPDPTETATALPSVGPSLLRLLGAFTLVLGAGFTVLWFVRRGVRFGPRSAGANRRLNVLEVRMLGNRQSLFVIGYDNQRMLLASTPTGINFLTNLLSLQEEESPQTSPAPVPAFLPSFADALQHALGRKA